MKKILYVVNKFSIFEEVNSLKNHNPRISNLGGIAIITSFYITTNFFIPYFLHLQNQYGNDYLAILTVIFFMGVYDDFLNISYIKKIIIQFCISGLFVYKTNLLLPMEQFDPGYFYSFSFIITILYIMLVMNSFNLIDGADGLLAIISIIGFLFFSIILFIYGNVYFAIFSLSLMAIVSAFLFFNSSPAKIFMGDSGSLFLGMVMASLSIVIIRDQNIFNQDQNILYKVLFSFSAISLPIFEVLRLIITRLKNRSNPFKGDNNHLHHILKRNHFSNAKKLLYITICQMILLLNTIITIDYSLIVCIVINLFIYSSFIVLIPAVSRYMGIGKLV